MFFSQLLCHPANFCVHFMSYIFPILPIFFLFFVSRGGRVSPPVFVLFSFSLSGFLYRKQHIKFLHLSKKVLLTPPDEGPRVKGQRIKLQDIVDGLFMPQHANGTWINGKCGRIAARTKY